VNFVTNWTNRGEAASAAVIGGGVRRSGSRPPSCAISRDNKCVAGDMVRRRLSPNCRRSSGVTDDLVLSILWWTPARLVCELESRFGKHYGISQD
jgi:hypothetical protein